MNVRSSVNSGEWILWMQMLLSWKKGCPNKEAAAWSSRTRRSDPAGGSISAPAGKEGAALTLLQARSLLATTAAHMHSAQQEEDSLSPSKVGAPFLHQSQPGSPAILPQGLSQ